MAGSFIIPTYEARYINSNKVYPISSVVVQMSKGVITSVFWDNVCFGGDCDEYTVTQNINVSNDYIGACTADNYAPCDPKIYVSFLGTDSEG